ncbi:hypothetical protein VNI00_002505 [Paramarasmius palmivorus]|uniref:Uncharacterized protein n=1 Tax=Paramarasmius palmivorus TaxID=297713 RepID=A0AAW0DZK7_9AGAR
MSSAKPVFYIDSESSCSDSSSEEVGGEYPPRHIDTALTGVQTSVVGLASGYVLTPWYRVMNLEVHVEVLKVPSPNENIVWISVQAVGSPVPFLIVPLRHGNLMEDVAEWVVQGAYRRTVNGCGGFGPDTHLRLAFTSEQFRLFNSLTRSPTRIVKQSQSTWADSLRYHTPITQA